MRTDAFSVLLIYLEHALLGLLSESGSLKLAGRMWSRELYTMHQCYYVLYIVSQYAVKQHRPELAFGFGLDLIPGTVRRLLVLM